MSADTIAQARAAGVALIAEARAVNVQLCLVGRDRIIWECARDPPPDLLARIKAAKVDVLAALAAEKEAARRRRLLFADHAAAHGADAARAFLTAQWRDENPPPPNTPGVACAGCGQKPVVDEVPFLAAGGGHTWMHRACWAAFDARRQTEAEVAVAALLGGAP